MNRYFRLLSRIAIFDFLIIIFITVIFSRQNSINRNISSLQTTSDNTSVPTIVVTPSVTNIIKSSLGTPKNATNKQNSVSLTKPPPTPSPQSQNLANELASHNSPGDCWLAINGHIYDITTYFGSHPGGNAYLSKYCGKDATAGFMTKDKSPGKSHSSAAQSLLQQYLIQ